VGLVRSALPLTSSRVHVHHREPPATPEDELLETLYCEELRQQIINYELDPKNFFRLHKRGTGRKI
jgi:hypothetical protein